MRAAWEEQVYGLRLPSVSGAVGLSGKVLLWLPGEAGQGHLGGTLSEVRRVGSQRNADIG